MPLKVGIIATFRGLLADCSLCRNGKNGISRKPGARTIQYIPVSGPGQHRQGYARCTKSNELRVKGEDPASG